MRIGFIRAMMLVGLAAVSGTAFSHGLVQDPPARNWFCGVITKPDHVQNGVAQFPICGNAFFAPNIGPQDGYNFMSVLTHTGGRQGVGPRANVCGFDSEAFNNPNKATVWDQAIEWPTTPMTGGPRDFVWSISWGPHFSDTSDFRYWITKTTFVWQTGRPLSFTDFEDTPFCDLPYDERLGPNSNPNVIPNTAAATFVNKCVVPARSGRHVIYAEWGRREGTFERFHGCIDAQFSGNPPPVVTAAIALTPNVSQFTGPGAITLNGTGSVGANLVYNWTVSAPNAALYTITNPMSATATLNLNTPTAAQDVMITLQVSNAASSDTDTRTFLHQPAIASPWQDLGALTPVARTLVVGDRVSVRTVSDTGVDAFWPTTPLTITATTTAATAWPLALGNAVNAMNGAVRVGVLNTANNTVTAQANATSNRVYAMTTANISSAFLQHVPGAVLAAPQNLVGTPGNAQAALTWNAVTGATGYNVKRSLTNGGPYANVSANQVGTSFTNTGLTNGTPYFFVVTALNASGESLLSNQVQVTPNSPTDPGGVTVTRAVTANMAWFNELQVRLANTTPITALTITVTVQRTTGVGNPNAYNTVGTGITQSNVATASTITYTWALNAGATLGPQGSRTFAAQFGGTGSVHPVTGDTWSVQYTTGGVARAPITGVFP